MATPSYYSIRNVNEGYTKAAQLMLVGGAALAAGSRTWKGRILGIVTIAGYIAIERAHAAYIDRHQLRLNIDLPIDTCLAMQHFLDSPRGTNANLRIQMAVDQLARAAEGAEAPKELLLGSTTIAERSRYKDIIQAHQELQSALAMHLNPGLTVA